MKPPRPDQGSRSPLGHVLIPNWRAEIDEQQFAKILVLIASDVAEQRRATSAKSPPQDSSPPQKGGSS